MIEKIKKTYTVIDNRYPTKVKIVRYLISGGTAATVNLSFLYFFTDILGIWYIISAVLSFLIAFLVSFSLQKYWTFKDHSNDGLHSKAFKYFIVTTTNLGINTAGIFIFVHYFHFHYLVAQIIVSIFIAIESYFVYHYIFKNEYIDKKGDRATLDV